MLDNEPTSAAQAAANEQAAGAPAAGSTETTPTRRSRRRTTGSAADAAQSTTADDSTARTHRSEGDAPAGTAGRPDHDPADTGPGQPSVTGEGAPAPRTRRARKATKAAATGEPGDLTAGPTPTGVSGSAGTSGDAPDRAGVPDPAGSTGAASDAEPAEPVKATRARRKKAAAPAEDIRTSGAAEATGSSPAAGSFPATGSSAEPTAPGGAPGSGTSAAGDDTEGQPAPVKRARRSVRRTETPAAETTAAGTAATGATAADPSAPDVTAPDANAPVTATGRSRRSARNVAEADDRAAVPRTASGETGPGDGQPGDARTGDNQPEAAPTGQPAGTRRRAAPVAASVLFMPPSEVPTASVPPALPPASKTSVPATVTADTGRGTPAAAGEPTGDGEPAEGGRSRRRRARRTAEPVEPVAEVVEEESSTDTEPEDSEDDDELTASGRRRRRRGRRGRGRGKGGVDEDGDDGSPDADADTDSDTDSEEPSADAEDEAEDDEDGESLTRRRRRRRRKGAADVESADDDGVPTVVRIREPRAPRDEVQGVSGSTRLEAKRQRRRDGREQRRTRPPILSESEFLARREAVDRVMVVRQKGDRTQIAVLEDGILVEHYVTRSSASTMVGNVYLGRVQNVLPSMEAAFVDIGRGRNAVLYAGEVNWDSSGLEGRARSIESAMRSGDSVLVQVTKDPIGHKGARLTSHIALSGRHLVYVPNGNASGISRKLSDVERKRLRDVLKKLVPDGAGVIVRTAAEGASEDELERDVTRLQAQWEDIQRRSGQGGAPALLSEEPDLVIRVVRDLFNEDFRELVVQGEDAYDLVEPYLSHVSPDLLARLRRHTGTKDVFAELRIDEQILKGLDRKVFLPSGGSLVIDRTEAMTVIDVNTGKYTGTGGNLEETVTRNNLEAAEEIVRQLRLRDLGGIVVIDFIDMVLESNRELVLRRLTECLGRDRTKHQVTEITSLGLVQMTRKRVGQGLLEAFSETCECCKGRGVVINTDPAGDKPKQAQGNVAVAKMAAASRGGSDEEPAAAASGSGETGSDGAAADASRGVSGPADHGPRSRRRGRKAASASSLGTDDRSADVDGQAVVLTAPDGAGAPGSAGAVSPGGGGVSDNGSSAPNGNSAARNEGVSDNGASAVGTSGTSHGALAEEYPATGAATNGSPAYVANGSAGPANHVSQGPDEEDRAADEFGDGHEDMLVGDGRRRRRSGSRRRPKP